MARAGLVRPCQATGVSLAPLLEELTLFKHSPRSTVAKIIPVKHPNGPRLQAVWPDI